MLTETSNSFSSNYHALQSLAGQTKKQLLANCQAHGLKASSISEACFIILKSLGELPSHTVDPKQADALRKQDQTEIKRLSRMLLRKEEALAREKKRNSDRIKSRKPTGDDRPYRLPFVIK
jgi:hypothetical protein